MNEMPNSASDTIKLFIEKMSETTGYKYLKSSRMLKKTVGSVVFEILFHSSKWNGPDSIRMNAEMRVSYKKYGSVSTVNSFIAGISFQPGDDYYYDISTKEKFNEVFKLLNEEVHNTAVNLSSRFEEDFDKACQYLLDEKFNDYHVELDFLEDTLGKDKIMPRVKEMIEALTDSERQQIEDYHNGTKNINWMFSRCNMRYIADKGYI